MAGKKVSGSAGSQSTQTKAKGKPDAAMQGNTAKRWAKLAADPRFGRIDRQKTKVEIDDRFKAMLEDSDFTGEGTSLPCSFFFFEGHHKCLTFVDL